MLIFRAMPLVGYRFLILFLVVFVASIFMWEFDGKGGCPEWFALPSKPLRFQDIEYEVFGPNNPGPPIVLIHGVGTDIHDFNSVVHSLASKHRVITYSLRGHGRTQDPGTGFDLPTLASDLKVLINALKLDKVVLVGHSAGGQVAMEFTKKHPELVSKLILEDIGVLPRNPFGASEFLRVRHEAEFLRSLNHTYDNERSLLVDLLPLFKGDETGAREMIRKMRKNSIDEKLDPRRAAVIKEFWLSSQTANQTAVLDAYPGPVLMLRAIPNRNFFRDEDEALIRSHKWDVKIEHVHDDHELNHLIHKRNPEIWLRHVLRFLDGSEFEI